MNSLHFTLTAGIAASLFLSNCTNSTLTPTGEHNNSGTLSAQNMGQTTFASIDESSLAAEMLLIENPAPENLLAHPSFPQTPTTSPVTALAKKAGGASVTIDTMGGTLRIVTQIQSAQFNKNDTVEVILDETVYDDIEGNEAVSRMAGKTVFTSGASEMYLLEDIDGDGIINRGTTSVRARLTAVAQHKEAGETVIATTILSADAGADADFETESDNDLIDVWWVKCISTDTVAYAKFTDADGDGFITQSRVGIINVTLYDAYKPLHPLVDFTRVEFTCERNSDGRERVSSFSAEKKYLSGRMNRANVTDESGNSTITADKNVIVSISTTAPEAADSEATAEFVYTIDPGYSIGDTSDNELLALSYSKTFRLGLRKESQFSCTFDPPVKNGAEPEGGTFNYELTYKSGKNTTLAGTFTSSTIDAVHTDIDGNKSEITITR